MKRFKAVIMTLAMFILAPVMLVAGMIEGTVMSTGQGSLFVVAKSGEHFEIAVPATTRIMRDGQSAKLEDLQAQDHVSVAASERGQERVATDIYARAPY